MEDKVKVRSLISHRVVLSVPDMRLNRVWEKKGTVRTIPFDDLEEAFYDPGVQALFTNGILGIDDMDVKKRLGIEPEDATEPVNVIALDDAQMLRYLTVLPIHEFREKINELPIEQVYELIRYAIEHEIANFEKAEMLKQVTGIDIISAIKLNRDDLATQKEE